MDLRAAAPGDLPAAAAMLARSFHHDPAYRHLFPDPATRGAHLQRLFVRSLGMRQVHASVVVGRDGAEIIACASWSPSELRFGFGDYLRHGLLTLPLYLGLPAVRRMLSTDGEVGKVRRTHEPRAPHAYLAQLGVDPEYQRRGIGREVLQTTLAQQAADRPAALLTTRASNVAFYAGTGFEVRHTARIGGSAGFDLWVLSHPGGEPGRSRPG